ncbi:hypothetical protein [Fructobacillus cardui]|uniref:hypothetical protein n=1 Tax=Fructobacillus cardui TaxID=2893170 RepID=UPI002D89D31B|nr:hypothetical protein R53653_IHELHDKM_01414 [Fructobacillus cardui]
MKEQDENVQKSIKSGELVGRVIGYFLVIGLPTITIGALIWLIGHAVLIFSLFLDYMVKFLKGFATLDAVIIVAIIGAFGTFVVNIWSKWSDHRWERNKYLTEKREKSYEEFLGIFFETLENPGKVNNSQTVTRINKFKQNLMLYGSKRTYKAFKKWWSFITNDSSNNDVEKNVKLMEKIISEMRNDAKAGNIKKKLMSNIVLPNSQD